MLSNGSITRIDRTGGGDAGGDPIITPGADLTALPAGPPRCFIDAVSNEEIWRLGATIKNVSRKCMVMKSELARAHEDGPQVGDQLTLKIDCETATLTLEAALINDMNLGTISHFEAYLKKV